MFYDNKEEIVKEKVDGEMIEEERKMELPLNTPKTMKFVNIVKEKEVVVLLIARLPIT